MRCRASRKLAIIGCEKAVFPIRMNGRTTTIREATATAFERLGLETIIHHPAADGRDFPKPGTFGALAIGGSSLGLLEGDLQANEWMRRLLDFIREAHGRVPMLGICYGHQAIARAFGVNVEELGTGMVYEAGFRSVSLTEDGERDLLFAGFPRRFEALYSHFHYIPRPPEGGSALLLGDSAGIHAFRLGGSTWGVQHHPEFTVESMAWLISARRQQLEEKGVDVMQIFGHLWLGPRVDDLVLKNFADFAKSC